MAFIDSKTFEVYSGIGISKVAKRSFECDDEIARTISILNLKGYKTLACCSGHPFLDYTEVKIAAESDPKESLMYAISSEEIKEENYTANNKSFLSKPEGGCKKIFRIEIKQPIPEAYILFEEGYAPDSVPQGWNLYDGVALQKEYEAEDEFEFFSERLNCMKDLTEWARNLPDNN